MPSVHLTRPALLDIDEIDCDSVERWGNRVAGEYLDDFDSALQRLSESPALLQERPGYSLRLRFYRVRVLVCDLIDDRVYVLAVRHTSMDLPRRLAELEPQLVYEVELLHARLLGGGQVPPEE